jgi:signal transduction histidine kinase
MSAATLGGIVSAVRRERRARRADPESSDPVVGLLATIRDLRRSRERLVAAADDDLRRIERAVHDGVQQSVVAVRIELGLDLERARDDPESAARLSRLDAGLERVLDELRDLASSIYPSVLAAEGLRGALEGAADRLGIPVAVDVDVGRHPPELESAVYRCVVEALELVAAHTGPRAKTSVEAVERDGLLVFTVAGEGGDVGAGTPEPRRLRLIADRLAVVGGEVEVETASGAGTRVCGTVPLRRAS